MGDTLWRLTRRVRTQLIERLRAEQFYGINPIKARKLIGSLSPRCRRVLSFYARGASVRGIAKALGTSPNTVNNQLSTITRKTGLGRRYFANLWFSAHFDPSIMICADVYHGWPHPVFEGEGWRIVCQTAAQSDSLAASPDRNEVIGELLKSNDTFGGDTAICPEASGET